jgi:flagellar hook protein FlgE
MSLFSTLNIGASGLSASSIAIAVIGDNVANINTTGFKSARPTFAVAFPHPQGTLGGVAQLGQGVSLDNIATNMTQGSLEATESALDIAITGKGFFQVMDDGGNDFYTRDGTFYLGQDGYLKTSQGHVLQGFNVHGGDLGTTLGDLEISTAPIQQRETSEIAVETILSAEAEWDDDADGVADTPYANALKDGTSAASTISALSTDADFATSTTIYDSLGVAHDLTIFFERVSDSEWTWSSVVDGAEVALGSSFGEEGFAFEISSGTLSFDTEGELTTFTTTNTATPWSFEGANTPTIDFQFGLDAAGLDVEGEIRMAGQISSVSSMSQDGYAVGNLLNVLVESDGTIVGSYSNGEELTLGQVAIALFASEGALQREGGNLYRATRNSGPPAMGEPNTAGRGKLTSYALEKSAVELEDQFVMMMQAQRSYQANARVVNAANDTLQELVNIV